MAGRSWTSTFDHVTSWADHYTCVSSPAVMWTPSKRQNRMTLTGKDRNAWLFLDQLQNLVEDVNFRYRRLGVYDTDGTEYGRCITLTNWSMFILRV